MLEVTAVRAFADNYIWLAHARSDSREVIAIDPGDAQPVVEALQQLSLSLTGIFVTHHHPDHVGGVRRLVDEFHLPVFGPASENLPVAVKKLREGDTVALASQGLEFSVMDIPGHTAGHIAFVGHRALFCGDTLFSAGCGRLFEGTPAQMQKSLSRLGALDEDTAVYCGHEYTVANLQFALAVEPDNADAVRHLERCRELRSANRPTLPSTIGLERKINPFLRCETETVKRAAERRAGGKLDSATEVLATLRDWKNQFKA